MFVELDHLRIILAAIELLIRIKNILLRKLLKYLKKYKYLIYKVLPLMPTKKNYFNKNNPIKY